MLRRPAFAFLALAFAVLRAGAVESPPEKTLTLRLPAEPQTLDWTLAHTSVETSILMNLMEGLTALDDQAKIRPALAESWSASKDGRVYTFRLRKNVQWSDGTALKASQFVESWRRLLSPVTGASYAYLLFDIEGAREFNSGKQKDFSKVGVKAPDDSTLVVTLTQPVAHWVSLTSFWVTFPVRGEVIEKEPGSWAKPGRMQTVGPYVLAQHDLESKLILRPNPYYYGKRGNVETVTFLIVKDDSTAMNLYESGKLDVLTDLGTLDLKRFAASSEMKTFPYLKIAYLGMAHSKFPFDNVHARRAVAMAVDKSKIGAILFGGQVPATSFVAPPLPGASPKVGLKFDPIAARKELAAAGLMGRAVEIDLITPNWDKQRTLAQYLQEQLRTQLNWKVNIQSYDHKTYRAQMELQAAPLFLGSWGADFPDADNFLSVFLSDSGNNRTAWKSKDYDAIVLKTRGQPQAARVKGFETAQRLLLETEAVMVPLYYEPNKVLVKPRVVGFSINPLNVMNLRDVAIRPGN